MPEVEQSMIARRTPIRRYKPKPDVRIGKLGTVRLSGPAMAELRLTCWRRDGGICQECGQRVNPFFHHSFSNSYHMAHKRNRRMYGDTLDNVRALCGDCHRAEHGNPTRREAR